ncbi:hypothetical protein N7488_004634 [Penicillium malachiteum]|nr:hypothetical protein N7488_004634 [Penicillium malachiteum]
MRLSCSDLLEPNIPQHQNLHVPSFSFLIEHPGLGQKILFDLGLRKNFASHPPAVQKFLDESHWELHVEKDITEILKESQVYQQDNNAIIFSHHHFDHIGDMNQFPSPTEVVVDPGFQNAYLPAWPVKPESSLIDEDWQRRQVREITFDNGKEILLIGGFRAFDYFGDGSLFLLDAPGHTVGHLAALARITLGSDQSKGYPRDQFVLLGGDICHYTGVFRPTTKSSLNPEAQSLTYVCPSSFFLDIHPETTRDIPY